MESNDAVIALIALAQSSRLAVFRQLVQAGPAGLSAGNDARLAELFAHAELRRGKCATNTGASDWIISADGPQLRGSGRSN